MTLRTKALALTRAVADVFRKDAPRSLQAVTERGWTTVFSGGRDPYDFQRDIHINHEAVLANWTVFACMTLIAGDVGKMRAKLMEQDANGIWIETQSAAFSPVLRKPNQYQTWQKFIESWILSKLSRGNAYVLKERDNRGVVTAMHVLDPDRVCVHVAADGSVYYRLGDDKLAGVPIGDEVFAPAVEIIHDRMWCLFHPLIGLSPIFACGLAATQGLRIQANSAVFFANMSRPSGTLTAPGFLTDEQAEIYKKRWAEKYGPGKQGETAILGNGLKYDAIGQTAEDSQLVDQLKLTAQMICSTFHVPGYKVGVGEMPPYQSAGILDQIYYDNCLQTLITGVQSCLDDGLNLANVQGRLLKTELDLDDLLRMDEGGLTTVLKDQVSAGIASPNEARKRINLGPVKGGESPMIQEQNYSLAAIAKRDAKPDPFAKAPLPVPAPGPAPAPAPAKSADDESTLLFARLTKSAFEIETAEIV